MSLHSTCHYNFLFAGAIRARRGRSAPYLESHLGFVVFTLTHSHTHALWFELDMGRELAAAFIQQPDTGTGRWRSAAGVSPPPLPPTPKGGSADQLPVGWQHAGRPLDRACWVWSGLVVRLGGEAPAPGLPVVRPVGPRRPPPPLDPET